MPQTIIYLHPHFTVSGGAGKFVLETGKRLAQKGYEIKVVSLAANKDITAPYQSNVDFLQVGGPLSSSLLFWLFFPFSYYKVSKILQKYPEAIIFPQVFPANWWGFLYKFFHPRAKMVWMCQEPSAFIHSNRWIQAIPNRLIKAIVKIFQPLFKVIDINLAKNVDEVICNSGFTKSEAEKIYPFFTNKITVAHLGADLQHFSPKRQKRRIQITTVCRLSHFKNVDLIIRSLALLNKKSDIKTKLVIVGEGEAKKELEALTDSLGITKDVAFMGDVTDPKKVASVLRESRAFVLASVNEPFGIAPIEAMACGAPAVVTATGGLRETVVDGKTGFYFRPGDALDLAEKLFRILSNETLFSSLSRAAVKRAQSFSWDQTTRVVERVLQKFI